MIHTSIAMDWLVGQCAGLSFQRRMPAASPGSIEALVLERLPCRPITARDLAQDAPNLGHDRIRNALYRLLDKGLVEIGARVVVSGTSPRVYRVTWVKKQRPE